MCGISGKVSRSRLENTDFLKEANFAMFHRGPDEGGIWTSSDKRVGLAHQRLSIVDLARGNQPMVDEKDHLVIVFNGEIYNHIVLKKELSLKGHNFKTNSDTEVILKAYTEWGNKFLAKLVGMFAFCIYDKKRKLILLARDRAGEKPLYFFSGKNGFVFASELKALLKDKSIERRFNLSMLEYYLTYGAVRGPDCLISGIEKILPGHALIYDIEQHDYQTFKYWELPAQENSQSSSESELVTELDRLLEMSVAGQLLADVPVGILLSGGLDSSLITAMAARVSGHPLSTYTVSFPGADGFDEAPYAEQISSYFGTRHEVLEVEPFKISQLASLARQFDEPVGDQAIIPTYLISKVIGKKGKVALSGDGGDELFCGYSHYSWIEKHLALTSKHFLPIGFKGRNHLVGLEGEINNSMPAVNMFFDRQFRERLLSPISDFSCSDGPEEFKKSFFDGSNSAVRQAMVTDFHSTLADTYLVKVDRSSMLASLEVRCPWLDHKIIEFAFSRVPDHLRITQHDKKILPKLLAKKLLPADFNISRKQGFNMPMQDWFKGNLKRDMEAILMDMDNRIFDVPSLKNLIKSQEKGNNNMQRIFSLMMLSLWASEYEVSL